MVLLCCSNVECDKWRKCETEYVIEIQNFGYSASVRSRTDLILILFSLIFQEKNNGETYVHDFPCIVYMFYHGAFSFNHLLKLSNILQNEWSKKSKIISILLLLKI